jgi:hypothetical protein
MAAVPAAVGASLTTQIATFVVNLGASYLLGRLSAQDGPRLDNLSAAGGEYGVAMPRVYGEAVRLTGIFMAQDDIVETEHTVEDYSELIGAATGALEGFMLGGPVGAAIGAVAGGLLGFAMPDQHYYTYSDTFALLLSDRLGDDPIEGLAKLWASGKRLFATGESAILAETFDADGHLIMRKWGQNRYFKSLTLYAGNTAQGVDPVLAGAVAEDGGYPFICYIVVEDLQLAQFGNSVPAIEGQLTVKTGQSLADAAELICAASGIAPEQDMSSTALADKLLRGYSVDQASTCWDALKPLLPAFGVDAAEVAGQIRFNRRSQALRATIPLEEMGAHAAGESPPGLFDFKRGGDLALPLETSVTFVDPARDYLPNTATSSRSEGDARSNVSVSLPLVLSADEGASAAALMHWDAWLGRTALGFSLTDTWRPEVGLAYAIPVGDQYVPYRLTRALRGVNGITEVEAASDEAVTYSAVVAGTSGTLPDDGESTLFPDTRVILIDMPITADVHDDYGFYVAMGAGAPYWTRGAVQMSSDGVNFVTLFDVAQSCPAMGDVTGTLAAGATDGLDDTLDTTSVLTVVLLHDGMEMVSVTDAQLDAWANFAFVGADGQGEYLQFKTATKIAPKTWELTDLRRGRKGTDWAIGLHGAGEEFALLGHDGVFRAIYSDTSQWGTPLTFRGVTLHQEPEDADERVFTNTGEGKRPYSPVVVEGSWDGSNNLTISWTARSRLNAGGLGIDDQDNYEVEITSGAGRTITATGVETATYSAADQTTDGITPGHSISGRVRQLSDVNDGRWREFTLVGPAALRFDSTATTFDNTLLTWDA